MKNYIIVLVTFLFIACDDCGESMPPPLNFNFELISSISKENMLTKKTLTKKDIKITNLADAKQVNFWIENNTIKIATEKNKSEIVTYEVQVFTKLIFKIYLDIERVKAKCNDYSKYRDIKILGANYEKDKKSGFYKVFIEIM